jgi:hypothetical protein
LSRLFLIAARSAGWSYARGLPDTAFKNTLAVTKDHDHAGARQEMETGSWLGPIVTIVVIAIV